MHPSIAEKILNILHVNHVKLSDLIILILSQHREQNINRKFDDLIKDLLINGDQILNAFASHPVTEMKTKNWAHARAKDIYLEEITRISSKSGGFHFRAYDASSQQIMGFDAGTLIPRVEKEVPFLWDLNRSFLGTREEKIAYLDMDEDEKLDPRDVVCGCCTMYTIKS